MQALRREWEKKSWLKDIDRAAIVVIIIIMYHLFQFTFFYAAVKYQISKHDEEEEIWQWIILSQWNKNEIWATLTPFSFSILIRPKFPRISKIFQSIMLYYNSRHPPTTMQSSSVKFLHTLFNHWHQTSSHFTRQH